MAWTILWALAAAVALWAVGWGARTYWKQRGARIVNCPETGKPASVAVDAAHAVVRPSRLRLESCSRWPEHRDCGQQCLREIAEAADGCLLRNMAAEWCRDKECVYCKTSLAEIEWTLHPPALLSPAGAITGWGEIAPEQIHEAMGTHRAVCWTCSVTNRFVREHPELVTHRSRMA